MIAIFILLNTPSHNFPFTNTTEMRALSKEFKNNLLKYDIVSVQEPHSVVHLTQPPFSC